MFNFFYNTLFRDELRKREELSAKIGKRLQEMKEFERCNKVVHQGNTYQDADESSSNVSSYYNL